MKKVKYNENNLCIWATFWSTKFNSQPADMTLLRRKVNKILFYSLRSVLHKKVAILPVRKILVTFSEITGNGDVNLWCLSIFSKAILVMDLQTTAYLFIVNLQTKLSYFACVLVSNPHLIISKMIAL